MMLLAFQHRLPAEALHAFQQLADAGLAVIGDRLVGLEVVDEFLVLGADAPFGLAGGSPWTEWRTRSSRLLDRAAGGLRNGHENTLGRAVLKARARAGARRTLFLY